jgi:signal transduction histidine kinase
MPSPVTSTSTYQHINNMLAESLVLRVNNISLSIERAQEALELSKENNYKKGEAYANSYLAFYYMIITRHQEAVPHIDAAILYFEVVNDKFGLAFNYNTYGSIHYKTDDYHFGLKYLLKAYNLYYELKDVLNQSRTLKSIGAVYEFFKDYAKAKKTYLKSIALSESIDDLNGISNALSPLSGLYLKEHNVEKASETIEKSVLLKEKTKDIRGLGFALHGKGKVLDYQNKTEEAENTYLKSLEIHENLAENLGAIMTLNKLGQMYFRIGKNKLAKKRLTECIELGGISRHNLVVYKAYKALYQLAKNENNIEEALRYLEKHNEYKERVQKRDIDHVLKSVQSLSKIETLENEARWQKEKTDEVEKKNKELDNFVYKVSHDLRGPISSLLGLHNVVNLDVSDKKSLDYFGKYHEQIKRLENIILDFIDLTRLKESSVENIRINFEEIIEQCIKAYNYLPNFNGISFKTTIEDSIEFYSDKSSINSILQNLIENAIKYSNPRKESFVHISVSLNKPNRQLVIKVEDNGAGIHDNFKSKIFDMFFRANDNVQGSGLGLYILKTAVDRIEGKVTFSSEYKMGSTFVISIPIIKNRVSQKN